MKNVINYKSALKPTTQASKCISMTVEVPVMT